ncbi:hypothetical protein JCM10212_002668 [Sporobolomyces blumeae]
MIGPLLKAQLVAFATKKLLESRLFVGAVEQLHGTVSNLQRGAYDALLQATERHDRHHPPAHLKDSASSTSHRPSVEESLKDQNSALRKFIEKTERELERERNQGTHQR